MNKVAAVLGVGPGLGAAIARRFAREGFAVALMARNEDGLSGIRQEIEAGGAKALPVSVEAAFERVHAELGDPEVFVYNAGAFQMGGILEIAPEKFDECFMANCAGEFSTPYTNTSSSRAGSGGPKR